MADGIHSHGRRRETRVTSIAAVIAAYNEEENIGPLTERLIRALEGLPATTWKLIYVIEGTDQTRVIAEAFALRYPQISILYNERPSGLGNAFRRGFDAIPEDTDVVVTMDADLNHQPEQIPDLVAALEETGADILIGSRRAQGSTVEGMPLWKNTASRVVNSALKSIMRLDVNDMTSGFRVYRRESLGKIRYSSANFAFLPEILISAVRQNMKIVERPIRFVFREAGESKMDIPTTGVSYIKLFARYSLGIPAYLIAGILMLGIAMIAAFSFPVHTYPGDADAMLAGLCAMDVQDGKMPLFFPGGYRLSSQSCYVAAGMFTVFGVSRTALAATTVVFGILYLIFALLALREAVGVRATVVGFILVAVPPVQYWLAVYQPWAYSEIMASSALALWLGLRLIRKAGRNRSPAFLLFGGSVGFAFWASPQSLMVSGPVILLALMAKAIPWPGVAPMTAGFVAGVLPYLAVILSHGLEPFRNSFATKPVAGLDQLVSNFSWMFGYSLPALLFSEPESVFAPSDNAVRFLLFAAAAAVLWIGRRKQAVILVVLLLGCSTVLYCVSGAGSVRGWTVRYVLPMYLLLPFTFAIAFASLQSRRARAAVAVSACVIAILHVIEYPMFNQRRSQEIQDLAARQAAVVWMKKHNRNVAVGSYWTVYSVNFDAKREIRGIPIYQLEDYFHFADQLQNRMSRVCLLERNPVRLQRWIRAIRLPGKFEKIADGMYGYVIDMPLTGSQISDIRGKSPDLQPS